MQKQLYRPMSNTVNHAATQKKLQISMILNAITIIGFLITIGTFIYSSGKKDARLEFLEKDNITLHMENTEIKKQLKDQNDVTITVNGKLDVLLDHFDLKPPKPANP